MRAILTILAVVFVLWASPAAAGDRLSYQTSYNAHPRAVAAFMLAQKRVEMVAMTRRARADTPLRRAHLGDCETMAKVMPGYPQPAFMSVDFRLNF